MSLDQHITNINQKDYFADGSMLSLSRGSPGVARLLPLARDVLDASRR